MNDFKIVKLLGTGVQGSTFLATKNKKQCCIKQIECRDDESSQESFNEMKDMLQVLSKEKSSVIYPFSIFIQWDEVMTTFFYFQVVPYFPRGDFKLLMEQQYEKKEAIKEETIEEWTGQIIGIFKFLKSLNIVHRSVRPSNFLLDEADHVYLTDICSNVVMKDVQIKTRSSAGYMTFMSPEVVTGKSEHNHDTDFWSMGAVLVGLMQSHMMTYEQYTSYLIEFKFNKKALVSIFDALTEFYSNELIASIKDILHPRATSRITLDKVDSCSHLRGILDEIERKRELLIEGTLVELDQSQSLPYYMHYMLEHKKSRACFRAVLQFFSQHITEGRSLFSFDTEACICIVLMCVIHIDAIQLCEMGLRAVSNQVQGLEAGSSFFSIPSLSKICRIALKYSQSLEIQSATAKIVLASKKNGDEVRDMMQQLKVVWLLIDMLKNFNDNVNLIFVVFQALWPLMLHDGMRQDVHNMAATELIVKTLDTLKTNAEIFNEGCKVMFGLSLLDKAVVEMNKWDLIPVLMQGLLVHQDSPPLIANCCSLLGSMVDAEEESSYVLSLVESEGGFLPDIKGIELLSFLWKKHMDDYRTAHTICKVIYGLTRCEDIVSDIKCGGVWQVVNDMAYAYIDKYEFRQMCIEILKRVRDLKPSL